MVSEELLSRQNWIQSQSSKKKVKGECRIGKLFPRAHELLPPVDV